MFQFSIENTNLSPEKIFQDSVECKMLIANSNQKSLLLTALEKEADKLLCQPYDVDLLCAEDQVVRSHLSLLSLVSPLVSSLLLASQLPILPTLTLTMAEVSVQAVTRVLGLLRGGWREEVVGREEREVARMLGLPFQMEEIVEMPFNVKKVEDMVTIKVEVMKDVEKRVIKNEPTEDHSLEESIHNDISDSEEISLDEEDFNEIADETKKKMESVEETNKIQTKTLSQDELNPSFCVECKILYNNTNYLWRHMRRFHENLVPSAFTCNVCNMKLFTEMSLKHHISRNHPTSYSKSNIFRMDEFAEFTTNTIEEEVEKNAELHGENNLEKWTQMPDDLKKLVEDNHDHGDQEINKEVLNRENPYQALTFYCNDQNYKRKNQLINQLQIKDEINKKSCNDCKIKFSCIRKLRDHILKVHEDQVPEAFTCDVCNAKLKTETNLRIHKVKIHPTTYRKVKTFEGTEFDTHPTINLVNKTAKTINEVDRGLKRKNICF